MAHYLMALLGGRGMPTGDIFGDAAQSGRMGDYVFNQEGAHYFPVVKHDVHLAHGLSSGPNYNPTHGTIQHL